MSNFLPPFELPLILIKSPIIILNESNTESIIPESIGVPWLNSVARYDISTLDLNINLTLKENRTNSIATSYDINVCSHKLLNCLLWILHTRINYFLVCIGF